MISLGFDYFIRITTDRPVPSHVLDDVYEAVNSVLAEHLPHTNYDTEVGDGDGVA